MKDVKAADGRPRDGLRATLVYELATIGTVAGERFARKAAELELKPKHAGLLAAIEAGVGGSQQELAARMDVVPSLVVSLADHLERLGAVRRVRDPADRRRQLLHITDHGRALLGCCLEAARELDDAIAARLSARQRAALSEALGLLADDAGL